MTGHVDAARARFLPMARAGWLVLAVVVPVVLGVALASRWTALQAICRPDTACARFQLSAAAARTLRDHGLSPRAYALITAATMVLALLVWYSVAGLLVWRKAHERGAFLAACFLVVFPAWGLGRWSAPDAPLAAALNAIFLPTLLLFALLFPDGRFVPRWTRWLAVTLVLALAVTRLPLPPAARPSAVVAFVVIVAIALVVPAVQIYRYRVVSSWVQRQQAKWAGFGLGVAIVGFLVLQIMPQFLAVVPPGDGSLYAVFSPIADTLVFSAIPICIAIAVLRDHLWDIDLILNRTLVYTALTAGVIGLYVLVVVGLGTLLRASGRGVGVLSVLATAVVALLVQPLRERLQRGVNRLTYGERDDPYAVLSRLGRQLEATAAPGAILPAVAETVATALKLPYVAIALEHEDNRVLVAAHGTPGGAALHVPLVYQGATIGALIVSPRTGTSALSAADLRLLTGLAQHAGVAAYAVRLSADLQRSRERLVVAREEERRRLRRDLHDGLGPTLASLFQRLDIAAVLIARDPTAAVVLLDELKGQVKATIADIRQLVYALRPPTLDEYGLVSALREHAMPYSGAHGLRVSFQVPTPLPALPAAAEVAAYRIALEALTNVVRHAQAHACVIELRTDHDDHELRLEITDDGVGLPAAYRAGVGLLAMRERAAELGGECTVEPGPLGGTRVSVRIPISKE